MKRGSYSTIGLQCVLDCAVQCVGASDLLPGRQREDPWVRRNPILLSGALIKLFIQSFVSIGHQDKTGHGATRPKRTPLNMVAESGVANVFLTVRPPF